MVTLQAIEDALPADAASRPLVRAMYGGNEWLMKPMLEFLTPDTLPGYVATVERIWRVMRQVRPTDEKQRIDEAIKGLQFHSMEFLKLQMKFAKTGEYRSQDFDAVYQQVYGSGDVMRRYLDGLLLTYVAWPNHYRLLTYYEQDYLAHGPRGRCLEIGPGHGWLAMRQLEADPRNTLLGLDVSPHSVAYTNQVLAAAGVERSRYDVKEHDALRGGVGADRPFDRIVIAEVLEHLPDPRAMMRTLVRAAHRDTVFFVTTVVNIEAPDHIYLFRELEEVRALLRECGLGVMSELDLPLKMNLPLPKPAYEVALICRPGA